MSARKILLVDDTPANLALLKFVLVQSGYEVSTAIDAPDAINQIAASRPHLILMDVQLPGMDGLELTRALKAAPETSAIPIVAVTSYAMLGDKDRALAAGCDGYLSKPIDIHALPSIVGKFFES